MLHGITVKSRRDLFLPREHVFRHSERDGVTTVAVAAGRRRDPSLVLPDLRTFRGRLRFRMLYLRNQRPSRSRRVAELFCRHVVRSHAARRGEAGMKEWFRAANEVIEAYNRKKIKVSDYLMNDYAGCTGAAVQLGDGTAVWGYIGDAGVACFDRSGVLARTAGGAYKLRTPNDMLEGEETIANFDWRNPADRKYWRKKYRNNPGQLSSFGVLTGERKALAYVRTGSIKVGEDDLILVYTRGFEHLLEWSAFCERLGEAVASGNVSHLRRFCRRHAVSEGAAVLCVPDKASEEPAAEDSGEEPPPRRLRRRTA
jgi:hypothetical protein